MLYEIILYKKISIINFFLESILKKKVEINDAKYLQLVCETEVNKVINKDLLINKNER